MSRRAHKAKTETTITSGPRSKLGDRVPRSEAGSQPPIVTDTWPTDPSVSVKEVNVIETFLGRLIDELFSES